jgi:hypothetical protein
MNNNKLRNDNEMLRLGGAPAAGRGKLQLRSWAVLPPGLEHLPELPAQLPGLSLWLLLPEVPEHLLPLRRKLLWLWRGVFVRRGDAKVSGFRDASRDCGHGAVPFGRYCCCAARPVLLQEQGQLRVRTGFRLQRHPGLSSTERRLPGPVAACGWHWASCWTDGRSASQGVGRQPRWLCPRFDSHLRHLPGELHRPAHQLWPPLPPSLPHPVDGPKQKLPNVQKRASQNLSEVLQKVWSPFRQMLSLPAPTLPRPVLRNLRFLQRRGAKVRNRLADGFPLPEPPLTGLPSDLNFLVAKDIKDFPRARGPS